MEREMGTTHTYPDRPKVQDLSPGDRVSWDDDRPTVRVKTVTVETRHEGSITVEATAECRGPQGGRVVLETTSTGRNRAKVGRKPWAPAYTVEQFEVVN